MNFLGTILVTLRKKAVFMSFLVFLPLLLTLPSTGSSQSTNDSSGYRVPFSYPTTFARYSTFVDQNKSEVNIYSSYLLNTHTSYLFYYTFLILSNSTLTPNSESTSKNIIINTTSLVGNSSSLNDFDYFISNNSRFLIISSSSQTTPYPYNTTILDLSNNRSYSQLGNFYYNIVSVNRFATSPDVYFVLYNSSTFLLVKYNFQSNSFSNVLNQTVLNNSITNVNANMLNDKLDSLETEYIFF